MATRAGLSSVADRRAGILDGALEVFAQHGYTGAGMDDIARAAGVAKPTLYNHFADKAALFVAVLGHYAQQAGEQTVAVIEALDLHADDLGEELRRVGLALVACLRSPQGHAVLRMQLVEAHRFPQEVAAARDRGRRRTLDALAGKLAQLAVTGRLAPHDPARAARHFLALVTDDLVTRSGYGVRAIETTEAEHAVSEGVETFLSAFGPR